MRTIPFCVNCQIRSFLAGLDRLKLDEEASERELRRALTYFSQVDYDLTPVVSFIPMWQRVLELNGGEDILKEQKHLDNMAVAEKLPEICADIKSAPDPFYRAMQYAIAANVNDPLPQHGMDSNAVLMGAPNIKLTVDDAELLKQRIRAAKKIVYLTDNAGEIAMDKVFLDVIFDLNLTTPDRVTVATRGIPCNNDALRADADEVGISDIVKVVDTGDASMGVTLSRSSEEFLREFYAADLIISKGMGNYESLDYYMDQPICYLMMIKCRAVSESIGLPIGSFVCLFNDVHLKDR